MNPLFYVLSVNCTLCDNRLRQPSLTQCNHTRAQCDSHNHTTHVEHTLYMYNKYQKKFDPSYDRVTVGVNFSETGCWFSKITNNIVIKLEIIFFLKLNVTKSFKFIADRFLLHMTKTTNNQTNQFSTSNFTF